VTGSLVYILLVVGVFVVEVVVLSPKVLAWIVIRPLRRRKR
jgi:hypothetical protein